MKIPVGEDYRPPWSTWPAKLDFEAAQEIRRRRAAGERGIDLADAFNVDQATIADIVHGLRYPADDPTQRPYYAPPAPRGGLPQGYWRGKQHPWLSWRRRGNEGLW